MKKQKKKFFKGSDLMKIKDFKELIENYDDDLEIYCKTPNGEEWDIKELWKIGVYCGLILRRTK